MLCILRHFDLHRDFHPESVYIDPVLFLNGADEPHAPANFFMHLYNFISAPSSILFSILYNLKVIFVFLEKDFLIVSSA